jgi:hypothetical protein
MSGMAALNRSEQWSVNGIENDKTPGITYGSSGFSRGIRGKEKSHPIRMAFL